MNILLVFAISLIFMMVIIMKFKVNCSVALFGTAILAGLLAGMPVTTLVGQLTGGFGSTMTGIGLVILFGGCMGALLSESGAMEEMAKALLRKFGKKHDFLALNIAGFLISIPIFFAVGYMMLSPLANAIQKLTRKRMSSYCTAVYVGLIVTHCLIMPTPGPVAVAAGVGADLGWYMLYSFIVAIPASLVGGVLWAVIRDKRMPAEELAAYKAEVAEFMSDEELLKADPTKPTAGLAIGLLMLPVAMLVIGSVVTMFLAEGSLAYEIFKFVGTGELALFFSMLVNGAVLKKYITPKTNMGIMNYIDKAANDYGAILMLLGSAGCFAAVIKTAGIGDALIEVMSQWDISLVLMAAVVAALIRMGVGSAAAAMTTSVSIVWPMASALGYSPIIIGLAVCSGALMNRTFREITTIVKPSEMLRWYPIYHEMDILHMVDAIEERIKKTPTNLERLRKQAGYSQAKLAELSTVSLRSIQMYEQRNNDISKAQFNILNALAKVLKCSVYDLVDGGQ